MWYLLLPLLQVSVAAGDWERVWSIAHAPERLAWETRHVGEWLSVTKDVLQPRVLSEEGVLFDGPEWALAAVQTDMRVAAATTDVLEQVATFLPPHNHSVARIGGRWYRRADALDFTLLPDEVLLRRSGDRTRWIHTGASGWNYIDLLETESPLKRPTFKLKASSDEKNDVATVLSVREDWSGRFVVTAKLETAGLCIDALQEWYQEQYRNGAQIPVVMYPPQTIQWKLPGLTEDQQPAWGVYETVACPKKAAKPTLRSAGSPLHEDVATIMSAGYTEGGELAFSHFIVDAKLEAAGICISSEPSQANVELYRVGAELPVEYDSSQMRIDFQPGSLGASGEYGVISCPRPNALRSSKLGASEIVVLDEPATILLIEILEETKLNVLARLENTDKCIAVILDVPVRDMGDSNPVQVYVDPQDHFVTFMTQWMPSGTYRDVECPRQAVRGTSVTPYVYINSASPDNRALTLDNGDAITRTDAQPFDQPHDHSHFFTDRRIDNPLPKALQQFVDDCLTNHASDEACSSARTAMNQHRYDDLMSLIHDHKEGQGRWLALPSGSVWLRDGDPTKSKRLDDAVEQWTRACAAATTALDVSPTSCADFLAASDKRAALGFPSNSDATGYTPPLPPWAVATILAAAVVVTLLVAGGIQAKA